MRSSKLYEIVLQATCAFILIFCSAAKLPDDIKPCVAGDDKCIIENINTVLAKKYEGDESFGLSKLEPFKMDDIIISQESTSPLAIHLALRNPLGYGVKDLRARKVKGFGKNPVGRHEIIIAAPALTLLSDYKIDGKVLILPIQGEGKSNITLVQPVIRIRIDATSRNENGNTFMDIKEFRIECKVKRMIMQFDNLFNGDKALGDNINSFLNENWQEIYAELKVPFYDAIANAMNAAAKQVFKTIPYNEILRKMYIRIAFTAALVCSFLQFNNADFPNDPKPCKFGDEDCLLKAINFYLREKNQGDTSINLRQIDPIDAGTFTLKQGADNPVNIDLTFSNNKIYGVANATAYKARGFGKDLTKKHELRFKVPVASLIGDYKIQGRILILPISGSGKNNITMIDAEFILQWVGAPVEKDGETYMKTDKFRAIVKPSRVFFELQNLFNGDKALGDNMNLFLNENWKEIYQEVDITFSKELSKLMSSIIDSVFDKTPYNKLFVE
ncbi:uncharacterized protein LOC120766477 [Bactrocera tryoni]|uniref:uncharacterized protein LOC120766477 n=1 Tax=Bactrocera tryoni TaxID=59916 RepID=UPI001A958DD7|nr:uncharacterized protein LOC120766477 [Bactrocera tryoni]